MSGPVSLDPNGTAKKFSERSWCILRNFLSPGLPRPAHLNIIVHKYSFIKFNRVFKRHYEES